MDRKYGPTINPNNSTLADDLISDPVELIEQVMRKFAKSVVDGMNEEIDKKNRRISYLEEENARLRADLYQKLGSTN